MPASLLFPNSPNILPLLGEVSSHPRRRLKLPLRKVPALALPLPLCRMFVAAEAMEAGTRKADSEPVLEQVTTLIASSIRRPPLRGRSREA
mmetsp:Transcript_8006/g.11551  ORF Transcript_8006/g.11551 Transcript_8006/m.11551 type:complete len:91 (+) Transcript_8006:519-791(+)